MPYEEKMQTAIQAAAYPEQLSPESNMRSFLGLILAPAFAVIGLGIVMFVPPPSEIAMAYKPIGAESQIVNGGDTNDRQSIQTLAERIELAVGPELGQNTDCFDDLRTVDNAKLEKCGRLVYQALAEVNDASPTVFQTDVAQATSREALMQELKLAATEVCRERWSREGRVPDNSPACEVAMVTPIASNQN